MSKVIKTVATTTLLLTSVCFADPVTEASQALAQTQQNAQQAIESIQQYQDQNQKNYTDSLKQAQTTTKGSADFIAPSQPVSKPAPRQQQQQQPTQVAPTETTGDVSGWSQPTNNNQQSQDSGWNYGF